MERTASTTSSTDTLPRRTPGATLGPRPTFPEQHAEPAPITHDRDFPTELLATLNLTLRQIRERLGTLEMYDDAWGRPNAWRAFGEDAR